CPEMAPDLLILNIDRNPQSNYFQPTDSNTITQLKNTSSTGKDGIPVKILQSCCYNLSQGIRQCPA
ncbi:hypothetical protein HHI36_020508, partial [Cryptolaemus montrouzieri]